MSGYCNVDICGTCWGSRGEGGGSGSLGHPTGWNWKLIRDESMKSWQWHWDRSDRKSLTELTPEVMFYLMTSLLSNVITLMKCHHLPVLFSHQIIIVFGVKFCLWNWKGVESGLCNTFNLRGRGWGTLTLDSHSQCSPLGPQHDWDFQHRQLSPL